MINGCKFNSVVDKRVWNIIKDVQTPWIFENKGLISKYVQKTTSIDKNTIKKRVKVLTDYKTQLQKLQTLPRIEQKTTEWNHVRKELLTASCLYKALMKDKYLTRQRLVEAKAFPSDMIDFSGMAIASTRWGIMFEPMASRCYSQMNEDVPVHTFGLLTHPSVPNFGASPDGITDLGIMVEFKCPYSRVINGKISHSYKTQIQGQLAVCQLKECDYVDCHFITFNDFKTYIDIVSKSNEPRRFHGIILEVGDLYNPKFVYSPEGMSALDVVDWAMKHPLCLQSKIHAWKLEDSFVKREYFDTKEWSKTTHEIKRFWDDVHKLRNKQPK
jgi:putative phage-type endonuclease